MKIDEKELLMALQPLIDHWDKKYFDGMAKLGFSIDEAREYLISRKLPERMNGQMSLFDSGENKPPTPQP